MIERIKQMISNYEPTPALIRIGSILLVSAIAWIACDFEVGYMVCYILTAIIYGSRIFSAVPKFRHRNHYYRGYWSTGGWLIDFILLILTLVLPIAIAFFVG